MSSSSSTKENVRVVVRARPLIQPDSSSSSSMIPVESGFRFDMEKKSVSRLGEKAQGQNELRHDFDAVFDDSSPSLFHHGEEAPQGEGGGDRDRHDELSPSEKQTVFFERHVRPLIDRALAQGINLTLVTYGQTGSGKTHTMDGSTSVSLLPNTNDQNDNDQNDNSHNHNHEEVEGVVSLAMNRCVSILEPENSSNNKSSSSSKEKSGGLLQKPSPSKIISSAANPGSNEKSLPSQTASTSGSPGSVVWMRLAVKFVEIYNEKLVDLLAAAVAPKRNEDADRLLRLRLRRREDGEDVFFVENLLCFECDSVVDAMQWYRRGAQQKTFRAHKMNAHSSRSHCIFTMVVTICSRAEDGISLNRRTFEMNFVDLAGSERPDRITLDESKVDMRQKNKAQQQQQALFSESLHINGSLSTLGRVIAALSKGSNHVPFRESKLTSLLRHVLGSNGLLLFIACVSANNVAETTRTLVFASQARTIRVVASPVQDANTILIAQLRSRIRELESDLEAAFAMNGKNNNQNQNQNQNVVDQQSSSSSEVVFDNKTGEAVVVMDGESSKNNSGAGDNNHHLQQQQDQVTKSDGHDSSLSGPPTTNKEAVLSHSLYVACTKMQTLLQSNSSLRSQVDRMRIEQETVGDRLSELERENLNLREKVDILNSVVSVEAKSTESLLRAAVNGNSNYYFPSSSPTTTNNTPRSYYGSSSNQKRSYSSGYGNRSTNNNKSSKKLSNNGGINRVSSSIVSTQQQQRLPPLAPNNNTNDYQHHLQMPSSGRSSNDKNPTSVRNNNNSNTTTNNNSVPSSTRTSSSSNNRNSSNRTPPQNVVGLPLSLFGQK